MMKNIVKLALLLAMFAVDFAMADALPNLDRTDKVHSRKYLDSMNVYHRRPVRVNQSGFRPQDYKYAYVADPSDTKFKVIDANSGAEAWSGSLSLVSDHVIKPNMYVNGAFNSITSIYHYGSLDSSTTTEKLYRADFTGLSPNTPGEYFVVVGKDTSATFHIHPAIFNALLEKSLMFFGIQRCGNTNSHFHAPCHLKDGSEIGRDLTGGWHDCGDHFKVAETVGYAAYVLSMVYLTYQDKAEDRFGHSYGDTIPDGYPDILWEAKIGADYILKLYNASVEDGLIEKGDMYHTVGMSDEDHAYWDLPERQDKQPRAQGGPDRFVISGIGTNVAGIYAAALANVAEGFKPFDPVYSDSLLDAAKTIYAKIVKPTFQNYSGDSPCARKGKATTYKHGTFDGKGYYSGMGLCEDDAAAAAASLWLASGDTMYAYDLYKNKDLNNSAAVAARDLAFFEGGYMGTPSGFNNSWATDYQNLFAYVLFTIQKLILNDPDYATKYGLSEAERDMLSKRVMASMRKQIETNSSGDSIAYRSSGTQGVEPREDKYVVKVTRPYNLVWPGFDWGFNRYNLGSANAVFLLYELTGEPQYLKIALDNMYYNLGANPWDISFLMGTGDKNENHPHNRASNPDGYNAGAMPYEYRCPIGALMGGRDPQMTLIDDWEKYTATETCIDFSAQFLFPAQSLAQTLPPDNDGPLFSNIQGTPITETSAIVSWDANEVALVTVFYNTTPEKMGAKSVQQEKASKGGEVTLEGLEMGKTYYFFLEGMDTKRNISTDDNHGHWYQFTMTNVKPKISGVTICQVDNRSAKIYWWTDIRSNGAVKYGTSMSALTETQASSDGAVLFHEVTLTNLKAGTTYYFTVSSGMSDEDNGGSGYSFTTESEASYADLAIFIKPSSYQADCSNWQDCFEFWVTLTNSDTLDFYDFEVRLYLGDNPNIKTVEWANMSQNWKGNGQMTSIKQGGLIYGTPQLEGSSYYLPVTIKDTLTVSGRMIFQLKFEKGTFKDFENGWSIRPHTADDDPERFEGIDLKQGPYFVNAETADWEKNDKGDTVIAFTRDPYVTVYYHGKHIFGYGPDYSPENGPQLHRTVTLDFEKPFRSPYYSIEKEDYKTSYEGSSKVTPTGILDDLEMNGKPQNFVYDNGTRTDSFIFAKDTTLAYGNNYMEWVSWHNHVAGMPGYTGKNQYDCACAVVRSNVEIDTITTPLEKRYLVFDKSSYKTYQSTPGGNPKMVAVRVQLLDSTAHLLDTVNVTLTLGTTSGNVKFWSSATSTIPITTIQLVNGEATFYVSSEQVMVTTLFAMAGSSTQFEYQQATADLIIEELPPWPIIDIAKMVDTDCDYVPDALQISLSSEYQENQSFNSVKFVYGSDTIVSTDVISLSGKDLLVKANIKDTSINTAPSGNIMLYTNVGASVEGHEDFYQDGVPPTLLAVSVLERLDTAKSDRVYMQFSEPISAPGLEWPVQLFGVDGSSLVSAPTVKFVKLYNESLNVWEFEVAFAADGSSIVTENMYAQLLSNSTITDKSGNGISTTCGQPKLKISLKLLPVPMTFASISDFDQDGVAERVYIEYERPIDPKHYADSLSIVFGRSVAETLWVAGTRPVYAADGMSAVLDLPTPFSYGVTVGSFEGSTGGKNVDGAGLVEQHLGSGASYESNSVLAEDLVGPVILTASIDMSASDKFDVLDIDISEPYKVVDSSLVIYRQKQDKRDTAIYKKSVLSMNFAKVGIKAMYGKDDDLAVSDGDFVRLQPKEFSALVDEKGNLPSMNSPWVPIMSGGDPKIRFNVKLNEWVSRSGGPLRSQVASSDGIRLYALNSMTGKLDLIRQGQVVASGIDSSAIQGVIWKVEMTVPRGATGGEPAAWDSLIVNYELPIYSNLGSYVNRLSTSYSLASSQYLSNSGKVVMFVEWTNSEVGIVSEWGRAVATGAYIYKMDIDCRFVPNRNYGQSSIEKFSGKNHYDKTETFGVKRVK